MYLTFFFVELLLLVSIATQETVSDEPDTTTADSISQTKTADENAENPTTIQSEANIAATDTLDVRSAVSVDLEIKTTSVPEETTLTVETRSGQTESPTENEANNIQDGNKAIEPETLLTIPTTLPASVREAPELENKELSNREAQVSDSHEEEKSGGESVIYTSHINPNIVMDVKSRSGLPEVENEHSNNIHRSDLGRQAIQNIRNSSTSNPLHFNRVAMGKVVNGVLPSYSRQVQSYENGLLNEMLPYYTGNPMSQYGNSQSNAYTMNTPSMSNRIIDSQNILKTVDSGEHAGVNVNARTVYNPNLNYQYPSYGNNHAGYYKPLQPVGTEPHHNYNSQVPLRPRIPLKTISSKDIFPDTTTRHTEPFQILSKTLGLSQDGIFDHIPKQSDYYRRLLLDKYIQNYRPLSYQSPELGNLGQRANIIESKIPTYYPRMQENHQSNSPYTPIPNNYGG